jgi:hypothetical protein
MPYYSRISGKEAKNPLGSILPSCFEDRAAHVRLVPDSKRAQADARFCCPWPDAKDIRTLEQVVDLPQQASWHDWVRRSPIVANITDKAQLTEVEASLKGNLKHLQEVFRVPAQHLRTVHERVPVAQARRVPEAAIPELIAHPEDWEIRTARGIRPLRLLSQRVEDDLDLYENRVAVRLVDGLLEDLQPRIRELQDLDLLQREGAQHDVGSDGSRWRRDRLYDLWGETFGDSSAEWQIRSTLEELRRLRRALLQLQDMPLYRAVTRKAELSAQLRPTNILGNHPEYRKVAEVWRQWIASQEPDLAAAERIARRRRESSAFDRFGLLLVLRALDGLGWRPPEDAPTPAGCRLLVQNLGALVQLEIAVDGVITVAIEDAKLRIVPVLCRVTLEHRGAVARSLRAESTGNELVLLFGQPEASDQQPSASAQPVPNADSRMLAGWGSPAVLLVSPLALDSQERVARVLSSWLAKHALPSFPPELSYSADAGLPLPRWLRRHPDRKNILQVVGPASDAELVSFRERCADRGRVLEGESRRIQIRGQVDPRPAALDTLLLASQHAAALRSLQRCQVCGGTGAFEPRLDGGAPTWWCRCSSCEAEWGTRPCNRCKHPFPVLLPVPNPWPSDRRTDWVDRSFGRDLWSEPCWDPERPNAYRCPLCHCCGRHGTCFSCDLRTPGDIEE